MLKLRENNGAVGTGITEKKKKNVLASGASKIPIKSKHNVKGRVLNIILHANVLVLSPSFKPTLPSALTNNSGTRNFIKACPIGIKNCRQRLSVEESFKTVNGITPLPRGPPL